jgi:hypothetical protein
VQSLIALTAATESTVILKLACLTVKNGELASKEKPSIFYL